MIKLRQGKAKTILDNSRNSALAAVEAYNRPNNGFRVENYIVLMVISWTKLFHAFFQATIGERYFYKEKNGRYRIVEGERKAWELSQCIKQYNRASQEISLSKAVVANLQFFIGLRNKIEHKYWDGSELDLLLFGECQSLLFNYENFLVGLFGSEYSINASLAYALQFSHLRTTEQANSIRLLLSKDMQDLKHYIDKYRTDLSQEIYDSQEYRIKLIQIPKVSNTNRSDLAFEFVNWNSLNEQDRDNYNRVTAIIKDKILVRNVSNANLLRPSDVVNLVADKTGVRINTNAHALLWKAFRIRPGKDDENKFDTMAKFCVYDEPHGDYVYTLEWVEFVAKLFLEHGFSKENLSEKCSKELEISEYC